MLARPARRYCAPGQDRTTTGYGSTKGTHVDDAQLVIRVVAMPADTNASGDIFGGWLMSQMDIAAWVEARQHTPHRLVTVAVDNLVFHRPVFVGDCLLCYARVERFGRTSVTIRVDAMVERVEGGAVEQVTEGRFVLVAIGPDRAPIPIGDDTPGRSD